MADDFDETLRSFMQVALLESLQACASKSDEDPGAHLDRVILDLGSEGVLALARNPRAPGDDKRQVELAVSRQAYSTVSSAVVEADTSIGHVLQQLVLTHCSTDC